MARLTASDMIYCAPFNALEKLASTDEPISKLYDFDIEAAAQWVVWPLECRHVYAECLGKETTTHYWEPWSKQRWMTWKRAFGTAAEDAQHSGRARRLASQALQQMINVEIEANEEESVGSQSSSE